MSKDILDEVNKIFSGFSEDGKQELLRKRLRLIRLIRGISVADAAKRVGIHSPVLSDIENGHRPLNIGRLVELCNVYEVNWMDLASQPKDSVQLFGVSVESLIEEPEHAA